MSIARLITQFKSSSVARPSEPAHDPVRLATAAVLLEIAYADGSFTPAEDGDVTAYLERTFQLPAADVRELIEAADEIRANTIDHFEMTNHIRKNLPLPSRIEIVKAMWRIVYLDGKLTDYEGYLVRKLADLLGLEHHVMIEAKVSVLRERESA